MASQWFFAWGAHNFGPFSAEELKGFAASGRLQPGDTVWKEGMTVGVVAARIKNLFQLAVSPVRAFVSPPADRFEDENLPPTTEIPNLPSFLPQEENSPETVLGPSPPDTAEDEAFTQDNLPATDHQEEPPAKPMPPAPKKASQSTARGVSGVVIIGQDGQRVLFRKKCPKCGNEDVARNSMPIRNGVMRVPFYCIKCRKGQAAEIQGSVK